MQKSKKAIWITTKELTIYSLVAFIGLAYVLFVWKNSKIQENNKVLQLAQSIEASLTKSELDQIKDTTVNLSLGNYPLLKSKLRTIIQFNKNARFAYFYTERNGKLYFLVDSEPESSPDYSPTGQEFTEADPIDKKPFQDGKAQVTKPVTDRWGTWITVEIPVFDDQTGNVIAVFGMDNNAQSWQQRIMFEVMQSLLIVVIIIVLIVISRRNLEKNKLYRQEIIQREKAEKKLKESESYFRLLFDLNPQPMFVYDLNTMNITDVNKSATEIYRYSKAEFLSMTILDLKAPKEFTRLWRNLIEDPNSFQHTEIWNHKTKDNQVIQVEVHSHNLDFGMKNSRLVLLINVTEKLRIERTLQESQQTLSNLIDNLPGIIYRCAFDESYTMEYISEACLRITGHTSDEFKSNAITFNELILPEYQQVIREEWEKVIREKSVFEKEYEIKTASGEIKWIWERGLCHYGPDDEILYLEGYIEDIENRKQAEIDLRKLQRAIEQNPASIVITNAKGTIEYVNPRFTDMTGYPASEAIGRNTRILKSGMMPVDFYQNLWSTITSGKIWTGELINKTKSGKLYWATKSISPIFDKSGKITNYVAIGEDISEKKKIESELILAKEKAEESDRLKSAFLANISHEIRTPMNGILGFAELLKEPNLSTETQQEFLEMIERSGQRMLNIISDLIDISKIEAGETSLLIKHTHVNKMLSELHMFFLHESNQKNIQLDYHCEFTDREIIIETDSTKLNQILTNLIKNALKFTEKGNIKFGYSIDNEMIEFYVSDTGPGISDDQRELIFELFRQSTLNLSRKYEGAGLGLAISKAYVELLGGSIWLESEVSKGSTFYFRLPLIFSAR